VSRSHVITTFGVGSVYELRRYSGNSSSLHSVMILGLDWWSPDDLETVVEPVLQKALMVKYFKLPPSEEEFESCSRAHVPARRFPAWLVCTKCNRLGRVGPEFDDRGHQGPECKAMKCEGRGVPVRLVMACYHTKKDGGKDEQPGHVDDFPWEWWAFSNAKEHCPNPQLHLVTTPESAGLSGLVVRCLCEGCKKAGQLGRSLAGVFGPDALIGCRCFGKRPWLDDEQRDCPRKVRALLRGASNVYFPVTASALSIPPFSKDLIQVLGNRGQVICSSVDTHPMSTLVAMAKNLAGIRDRYSDAAIEDAILMLARGKDVPDVKTEREQRTLERRAIREGRPADEGKESQFEAKPIPRDKFPASLARYLEQLVRVHRLREVRALRGFCRVYAPDGFDSYHVTCAPLSRQKTDWLPAIVVRGEGIYLELDPHRVQTWETRIPVRDRIERLQHSFLEDCKARGRTPAAEELPTAPLVLLHTLAHLLIKQLSLECGYSSASLRERLYVDTGDRSRGVLIYTATTGADGTLGGLVRQGSPDRFERTFLGALEAARWCSSDPLCIQSPGQASSPLNLSACHACCLVSETSCELRNTLLDRALLLGTPDQLDLGFFDDVETWL